MFGAYKQLGMKYNCIEKVLTSPFGNICKQVLAKLCVMNEIKNINYHTRVTQRD